MENRRPPRSNSSGRKPYSDRARGTQTFRGDRPRSGAPGRGPRRNDGASSGDGRYYDPTSRGTGNRSDGRYARNRFGSQKMDRRPNDQRGRGKFPAKTKPIENEIKITFDHQITDGKFRGKTLLNSDSPSATRTERKTREVLFKIISRRVKAGRILDLGAGSGTIGIEAISRGAMLATFVERSARMCSFIRKNLTEMGIKDGHGEIVEMEILPFLKRVGQRKRLWDVVYFDLPTGDGHAAILDTLARGSVIKPHGLLVIQHSSDVSHPDGINRLKRWRTIDQGKTILSIYERI